MWSKLVLVALPNGADSYGWALLQEAARSLGGGAWSLLVGALLLTLALLAFGLCAWGCARLAALLRAPRPARKARPAAEAPMSAAPRLSTALEA